MLRAIASYVESLFDEFSTEIKVLFDRRDAASNSAKAADVRGSADQSSTHQSCRRFGARMRRSAGSINFSIAAKSARRCATKARRRRNSRELAVRNQFFTPRYVVQFLVDNTLGSLWQEMHGEHTRIAEILRVPRAPPGRAGPTTPEEGSTGPPHPRPRLRVGIFRHSFDLLLAIYEETWSAEGVAPRSELTGRSLREDYPNLADLRRAVPRLIVEHNLHGVDIDPRCAQIAALALWLRAQRAWKDLGIAAADRPRIQRTHIVVAEPMPGDAALVDEFAARLDPPCTVTSRSF